MTAAPPRRKPSVSPHVRCRRGTVAPVLVVRAAPGRRSDRRSGGSALAASRPRPRPTEKDQPTVRLAESGAASATESGAYRVPQCCAGPFQNRREGSAMLAMDARVAARARTHTHTHLHA